MANIRIHKIGSFKLDTLTDGVYSGKFIVFIFAQIEILFQEVLDGKYIPVGIDRLFHKNNSIFG